MRWLLAIALLLAVGIGIGAPPARAAVLSATLCAPYEAAWAKVTTPTNILEIAPIDRGMPAICPSYPAVQQAFSIAEEALVAAANMTGNWSVQGLDCTAPVNISLTGININLSASGQTTQLTLVPSVLLGVTEAKGDDGAEYSLFSEVPPAPPAGQPPPATPPPARMTIEGPNGTIARLTKCAA